MHCLLFVQAQPLTSQIVDLIRADLLTSCKPSTVTVPRLIALESHGVHHLVTTVQGRLRGAVGSVDVLGRCFPPGTWLGFGLVVCGVSNCGNPSPLGKALLPLCIRHSPITRHLTTHPIRHAPPPRPLCAVFFPNTDLTRTSPCQAKH